MLEGLCNRPWAELLPVFEGTEWEVQAFRTGSVGKPARCWQHGCDRDLPDLSHSAASPGNHVCSLPPAGAGHGQEEAQLCPAPPPLTPPVEGTLSQTDFAASSVSLML